jgi:hypothetical protein
MINKMLNGSINTLSFFKSLLLFFLLISSSNGIKNNLRKSNDKNNRLIEESSRILAADIPFVELTDKTSNKLQNVIVDKNHDLETKINDHVVKFQNEIRKNTDSIAKNVNFIDLTPSIDLKPTSQQDSIKQRLTNYKNIAANSAISFLSTFITQKSKPPIIIKNNPSISNQIEMINTEVINKPKESSQSPEFVDLKRKLKDVIQGSPVLSYFSSSLKHMQNTKPNYITLTPNKVTYVAKDESYNPESSSSIVMMKPIEPVKDLSPVITELENKEQTTSSIAQPIEDTELTEKVEATSNEVPPVSDPVVLVETTTPVIESVVSENVPVEPEKVEATSNEVPPASDPVVLVETTTPVLESEVTRKLVEFEEMASITSVATTGVVSTVPVVVTNAVASSPGVKATEFVILSPVVPSTVTSPEIGSAEKSPIVVLESPVVRRVESNEQLSQNLTETVETKVVEEKVIVENKESSPVETKKSVEIVDEVKPLIKSEIDNAESIPKKDVQFIAAVDTKVEEKVIVENKESSLVEIKKSVEIVDEIKPLIKSENDNAESIPKKDVQFIAAVDTKVKEKVVVENKESSSVETKKSIEIIDEVKPLIKSETKPIHNAKEEEINLGEDESLISNFSTDLKSSGNKEGGGGGKRKRNKQQIGGVDVDEGGDDLGENKMRKGGKRQGGGGKRKSEKNMNTDNYLSDPLARPVYEKVKNPSKEYLNIQENTINPIIENYIEKDKFIEKKKEKKILQDDPKITEPIEKEKKDQVEPNVSNEEENVDDVQEEEEDTTLTVLQLQLIGGVVVVFLLACVVWKGSQEEPVSNAISSGSGGYELVNKSKNSEWDDDDWENNSSSNNSKSNSINDLESGTLVLKKNFLTMAKPSNLKEAPKKSKTNLTKMVANKLKPSNPPSNNSDLFAVSFYIIYFIIIIIIKNIFFILLLLTIIYLFFFYNRIWV